MKKTQGGIMNKVIIAGIILFVAIVATGVVLMGNKDKAPAIQTDTSENSSAEGKKACELIDLEEAKGLLGDNAALLEGSGDDNLASTADVSVDNCSYSADGATLGDMKQLVIQVHSGNTAQVKEAYENYKEQYPGDALPEFGNTAYYATETKQVNVLKGGNWFFVGAGSMNGGEANKELTIQAAKIALENL
jgi:hypothetical protein